MRMYSFRDLVMKAAFLTGIGQVEIREVPAPQLDRPDAVLLRVDVVGVCGSDMHYYRTGRIGDQVVRFPWRVGHEFAATVIEVGPEAGELNPGTRVAVDPLITCGQCDQCQAHRPHTCRRQKFMGCPGQMEGCLAELVAIPAACCYPIPDSMTCEQAALIEPFSISLHAQRLAAQGDGTRIAILGAGPMGLGVLGAVRAAWRCTTYVTDLLDERLGVARQLGADWTGNAARQDMVPAIAQCEPAGLDCVVECAGQQETLDQGVELLAPGGVLVIVGIPETGRISFDMDAIRRKELRIQNVRRQNNCVAQAIEMLAGGKVNLDPLVTHHFSMDQTKEAFDLVSDYRDGVVKAMIHLK